MALHAADSDDPASQSLASRHARNAMFGSENCYVCHADYGMFGTVVTKAGGMRHVWLYLTEYRDMPLEEAKTDHPSPRALENERQLHAVPFDARRALAEGARPQRGRSRTCARRG